MALPFSWITLAQALAALRGRLYSSGIWSDAELQVYINEALRTWNALTEQWSVDFDFTAENGWSNLGTLAGSPRLRTVTDADLYTQMQYMLLEPPSGAGMWTGTKQFNLAGMQYALQKRRDEMIQATNCNLGYFTVPTTPGTRRNPFPDTTLEPSRIRSLTLANSTSPGPTGQSSATPLVGQIPASVGAGIFNLVTMTREDTQAFQGYQPGYLQSSGLPESWAVSSDPPLSFDVDNVPNAPGFYDVVALISGPIFAPPAATLLGVPDDWSWVAKWGALADLLSREPEATDLERAAYCLKRYTSGLQIMCQSNWLVQATIDGVAVDTPSMFEMDSYNPEWQADPNVWPTLVQAGINFVSAAPMPITNIPPANISVGVTLVGNQPIPTDPGDFIQVSRDVFDVILNYAQRLATFKLGGSDFAETAVLEEDFYRVAAATNKRLLEIGIYNQILHTAGQRQIEEVPR